MSAEDVRLEVDDLRVEIRTRREQLEIVNGVSLTLRAGQTLGLVGESGSGKSMTAYAITGLLPRGGRVTRGRVLLDGVDLLTLGPRQLADRRGLDVGMIFQEPRRSLNPAFTVGDQIAESLRRHRGVGRREARQAAIDMLARVHIARPEHRVDEYPYAFSGGMCQRVMLAIALACHPRVLIADEPTTALDVTVQASVLDLLRELQEQMGLALLLITHDLGVVAEMCDEIAVMYAGRIVERAGVRTVFGSPRHPYTDGLLRSIPDTIGPQAHFESISGQVPALDAMPHGCRFHPRCPHAVDVVCTTSEPPLVPLGKDHWAACVRADQLSLGRQPRG